MAKRILRASIVAVVLLLSSSKAEAAERLRLQLRWQHQFQFAGYYVASDRGYYASEGLEVELVDTNGERKPIAEVTEGRATYGVGSSDLVLARAQGKKVVALAAFFQHSPLVLLALKSSAIDSVHDLAGKRVAMENEAADLVAYLQSEGLTGSSYRQVPHAQNVNDLLEGRVDAMSAYQSDEPFELEAAHKEIRIFSPRAGGIDFYGDTLFTTEEEVRDHPERVDAVIRASRRGWEDALADRPAAIDAVLRRSQRHSRAHLEYEAQHTAPLVAADIVELGYMNPARWQHIADTYASLSLVRKDIDLRGLVYRAPTRGLPLWVWPVIAGVLVIAAAIATGWLRAHRLARALASATHRWRTFIEASPLPTVIVGDDDALLYQNPRASSLMTRADGHVDLGVLLRRADVLEPLRRGLETAPTSELEVALDVDTEATPRSLLLSAARSDADGARGILVSVIDVTAQKVLVQSLRRNAEIEQTIAAARVENQRRLVAILSHELRNPLAGIDRAANLLQVAPDLGDGAAAKRLSGIRAQVSRLQLIVDSILSTDTVGADSLEPQKVVLAIGALLLDVREALPSDSIDRVTVSASPSDLAIAADARLLRLALSNLVGNALRYSPVDRPVSLEAHAEGDMVLVEVADQGPGATPEELLQFGMPYLRGAGSPKGTGLGYYFSKMIVEAHGGVLVARNREGGGLLVTLRLPAGA